MGCLGQSDTALWNVCPDGQSCVGCLVQIDRAVVDVYSIYSRVTEVCWMIIPE